MQEVTDVNKFLYLQYKLRVNIAFKSFIILIINNLLYENVIVIRYPTF